MKRNPSPSGNRNLADQLAELRGLDLTALKQRWRMLHRTEAPVRIGQALLLQAIAYRLQERVFGGLKSSTRRLLERTAEDSFRRRTPIAAPATKVTPGSVLIREWHGVSHRVTVLADGVLLRGAHYRSLSEVARARDRNAITPQEVVFHRFAPRRCLWASSAGRLVDGHVAQQ